jgi:hypothetical protein
VAHHVIHCDAAAADPGGIVHGEPVTIGDRFKERVSSHNRSFLGLPRQRFG